MVRMPSSSFHLKSLRLIVRFVVSVTTIRLSYSLP